MHALLASVYNALLSLCDLWTFLLSLLLARVCVYVYVRACVTGSVLDTLENISRSHDISVLEMLCPASLRSMLPCSSIAQCLYALVHGLRITICPSYNILLQASALLVPDISIILFISLPSYYLQMRICIYIYLYTSITSILLRCFFFCLVQNLQQCCNSCSM